MKTTFPLCTLLFILFSCTTDRQPASEADGASEDGIFTGEYSADDCDKFLEDYEAYARDFIYLAENADKIDEDPELRKLAERLDEPNESKWTNGVPGCDSQDFRERSEAITERLINALMQLKSE